MAKRPQVNSESQKELDKVKEQLEGFENSVKDLTLDRMNMAPKEEVEKQTKLSQKEISDSKDIYLKPKRSVASREKFNEDYREQYNFAKEYVRFIAENREIPGETITMWTKPFAGLPAEEWDVPVNKPIWAPRYVAEQIKRASYHRLKTQDSISTEVNQYGTMFGGMVVDTLVQRLDAYPAAAKRSQFMGASNF